MTKTRLWLALTGWLPWACYFGVHDQKMVCRGRVLMGISPGEMIPYHGPATPRMLGEVLYLPRAQVCKKCGTAW